MDIRTDISQFPPDLIANDVVSQVTVIPDDGIFASVDGFSVIQIPWGDIRWFTDYDGIKRFMIVGQSAETIREMSRDGYDICIPPIQDEKLKFIQCANSQTI